MYNVFSKLETWHVCLVVIVLLIITMLIFKDPSIMENMATTSATTTTTTAPATITALNNEALQNIASVYNESELTITNLKATQNANVGNNLNVIGELSTKNLNVTGELITKNIVAVGGELNANGNGITLGNTGQSVIAGLSRVIISGPELLFLLNKSGVIVGQEWGGNGNLTVEGGLSVNGFTNMNSALHVSGPTIGSGLSGWFVKVYGNGNSYNNSWVNGNQGNVYSIVSNGKICASEVHSYSSIKKKMIIDDREEQINYEVEKIIDGIDFYKYKPIDVASEGDNIYYGVIAEELQKSLPDYVVGHDEYVPNIYSLGEIISINENNIELKINLDNDEDTIEKVNLYKSHINKKVKLWSDRAGRLENVLGQIANYKNGVLCIDLVKNECVKIKLGELIFVYGTYELCPSVAKDRLGELALINAKANNKKIKELTGALSETNAEVNYLKDKVANLEKLLEQINEKLIKN